MMFVMNSKDFQNEFLVNETNEAITDAQYVIVSTRIRKRDRNITNIILASKLYPDTPVFLRTVEEDCEEEYIKQLQDECMPLLATLILGSIKKGYNIIFICSKNESQLHYLTWLANFIYLEFGYPCYNYKKYCNLKCSLIEYDKDKVVKYCKKILKEAKDAQYQMNLTSEHGRESIKKSFREMSKKEMKKELNSRNLYTDGMSKSDMIETLELFM